MGWKIYGFILAALDVALVVGFFADVMNGGVMLPARAVTVPGPANTVLLVFILMAANAIGACRLAWVQDRF